VEDVVEMRLERTATAKMPILGLLSGKLVDLLVA
jgi:hypothetical protein